MTKYLESQKVLKLKDDDSTVEFEVEPLPLENVGKIAGVDLDEINGRIQQTEDKIARLETEIERLTNHADGIDYMVAVGCGILCGLIDSFFVGEFSLKNENGDWKSSKKVNEFVVKIANSQGYKGNDLQEAIKFLEDKYHIASDPNLNDFGGGKQHHLRDFAHHPTPVGLLFSLLTQFTSKCYGTNTQGLFIIVPVTDLTLIGKTLPEKFLFGVIYWFFHMVSDMAGSHTTPGAGTGLPGPIVSLLKEFSSLPLFQIFKNQDGNSKFSVWISKVFNGTLLAERDENGKIIRESVKNFDLRAELSLFGEIGRQSVPVLINECLVRGFYFIRHFIEECRLKKITSISELNQIEYKNILPFHNRTIARMMTIASGTFSACDLADAAIRSAVKNAGQVESPTFLKDFILRVNFVGIGRFALAVGTDVGMGIKKNRLEYEKIKVMSEQIELKNARMFCYQKGMWVQIAQNEQAMEDLVSEMENSYSYFIESYQQIFSDVDKIGSYVPKIREKNPGLIEEMQDILKWG